MKRKLSISIGCMIAVGCQGSVSEQRFESDNAIIMYSQSGANYLLMPTGNYLIASLPSNSDKTLYRYRGRFKRTGCSLLPLSAKVDGVFLDKARVQVDRLSLKGFASREAIRNSYFSFREDYICDVGAS